MKICVHFSVALLLTVSTRAEWFLHRTTTGNTTGNYSFLAKHLTSDRAAHLFVSPIQKTPTGKHRNLNLGLWYPQGEGQNFWSVFYESSGIFMSKNLQYSVYVAGAGDTTFTHQHEGGTNFSNFRRSYLDHPSLNNTPVAFPFVTQNWDASGGVYNPTFINTVAYDTNQSRWYIDAIPLNASDEFTAIPDNAAFNILVLEDNANTFRHTVNTASPTSALDHPSLNGNPNALVLVSYERDFSSFQDHFTHVQTRYDEVQERWVIESLAEFFLREGASYFITLAEASDVAQPTLTINASPPRNLISLPTEFGQSYQMQTSTDLNAWLDEGLPFTGNGAVRTYPTTVVLPSQNYRIIRRPE